jgi:scyllo-inositol 2-dehydrogenase (NADP+)
MPSNDGSSVALSLGVGLIGYGLAGSVFHARLILATDRLALAAVSTSRPLDLADVRRVPDPPSLFEDSAIDLVVVASPHGTHFSLAHAALLAGKHVVVDKPFALTSDEASRLIGLASKQGLRIIPFHNRRWDGDFLTVQDFLKDGRTGDLARFEAHWDRFRPGLREGWRESPDQGAGLLNDLGPHLVDQALQLFGWPEALSADIGVQREVGVVDDYFEITLYYGRLRVILGSTQIGAAPRPRFALHGTEGSLVKYGLDPQEERLKGGQGPLASGFGDDDSGLFATFTDAHGTSERIPTRPGRYLDFYEGVAAAILDDAPLPVDPRDARDGLRIIELARLSAHDGRRIDRQELGGEGE